MTGRIVLFSPRANPLSFKTVLSRTPLSLLTASSFLAKEDYDIKIVSATQRYDYVKKILDLINDGTICFGVTSMTGYQIKEGLEVSNKIKEKYPSIPIVWGGWHPSLYPRQVVEHNLIDIAVKGHGERTFTELVHTLENNSSLKKIKGIVYKEDSEIIENSDRPFEDINNFPPIPYHLIDLKEYMEPTLLGSKTISYISSYGCPFRCGFCAEQNVNKRHWTGRNAETVLNDMEYLINQGVDSIEIDDSNFFVDKERVRQICEGIIEHGWKISWGNVNGRAEQLIHFDDSLWQLLKKSGCYSILIGAESGWQKALEFVTKDSKTNDTIEFARITAKYKFAVTFSFITGLPELDNTKDIQETIKLIDEIIKIRNERSTFIICVYAPYPGTPLYNLAVKNGFNEPKSLEGWADIMTSSENLWIGDKNYQIIQLLCLFILPYIASDYQEKHNPKFRPIHTLFHYLSKLRWRHKVFSIPIDYKLFKFLKSKLG